MKLRPFELALLTFFLILAIAAVILLMVYDPPKGTGTETAVGEVSIWGTVPSASLNDFFNEVDATVPAFNQVEYRYVAPDRFDDEFIRALADGDQPDLVLISQEALVPHRNRLVPLSSETRTLRTFRDDYIDGAEVFVLGDAVYAVPIAVDPLVLFWNRTLFGTANLLGAPVTWEEFLRTTVPTLTKREFDRTITQSTVAFGEARNVTHYYPVLSMLAMQQGSQLVREGTRGYEILLDQTADRDDRPFSTALEFYMRFSDPTTPEYSWNRAQGLDRDEFLREKLALYFGFASEASDLLSKNPNLDFDVTEVPKGAVSDLRRTFGRFYGLALVKSARNPNGGAYIQQQFDTVTTNYSVALATSARMAPVSRTALLAGTSDLYGAAAYRAAPVARGWLAPGVVSTNEVFTAIIEAAATERADVYGVADSGLLRLRQEY